VCELAVVNDGNGVYSNGSSTHLFCAICNLAHSPLSPGLQFSLPQPLDTAKNAPVLPPVPAAVTETFAIYIRPPPAG
jgi:hypothetical protein